MRYSLGFMDMIFEIHFFILIVNYSSCILYHLLLLCFLLLDYSVTL